MQVAPVILQDSAFSLLVASTIYTTDHRLSKLQTIRSRQQVVPLKKESVKITTKELVLSALT